MQWRGHTTVTMAEWRKGMRDKMLAAQQERSSVNKRLTPRTQREAPEVAGAARRLMTALARRAAEGDIQALTELYELHRDLAVATGAAALALNQAHGYSWFEIGRAAGITRQAAQQRWGSE